LDRLIVELAKRDIKPPPDAGDEGERGPAN